MENVKDGLEKTNGVTNVSAGKPQPVEGKTDEYTVTYTYNQGGFAKTLTVTIKVACDENGDIVTNTKVDGEDALPDGTQSETTVTAYGSATVENGEITWSGTKEGSGFIGMKDGNAVVKSKEELMNQVIDVATGEKVTDYKKTDEGVIIVTTEIRNGSTVITKVYTLESNDDAESDEAKKELDITDADTTITGLTKFVWTVHTTTVSTETPTTDNVVNTGSVTKGEGDTYSYTENGQTITLVKKDPSNTNSNVYVEQGSENNGVTYEIIEENEVPLADITKMIRDTYGKDISGASQIGIDMKNGVATYTNIQGETVTVKFTPGTKITVTKIESTNSTQAAVGSDSDAAMNELIGKIKNVINAAEPDEAVYLTVNGIEYKLSIENGKLVGVPENGIQGTIEETEIREEIKKNTAINFDSMEGSDLIKYLTDLRDNTPNSDKYQPGHKEQGDSSSETFQKFDHINLATCSCN